MSRRVVLYWVAAGIAVLIVLIVIFGAIVVIDETEQAVIVRLGKPVRVIVGNRTPEEWEELRSWFESYNRENGTSIELSRGAGLYVKQPFVEDVRRFDDRLLEYDVRPEDIVTRDKKKVEIDNYAKWRIANPLLLLQTAQTEEGASTRLDDRIFSALRENLSNADAVEIVRSTNEILELDPDRPLDRIRPDFGRDRIMQRVTEQVNEELSQLGIQVIDVRMKRVELLEENERAVFDRMNAERNRISEQFRAEGKKEAERTMAETDREVEILLAEATKKAEILLGEGEAKAASTYAAAYETHREFFSFVRSLAALEKAVNERTRVLVGMESPLFRHLRNATKPK